MVGDSFSHSSALCQILRYFSFFDTFSLSDKIDGAMFYGLVIMTKRIPFSLSRVIFKCMSIM